jgi:gas vesicle protein
MTMKRGAASAVLAAMLLAPASGEAASCRNYGQEIQAAIKRHVEALRMIEREATDRIAGLDTRPYEFLLKEARSAADAIADQRGLDEEDELKRCRNFIAPVRHTCAAAAKALVRLIEEQAAGAATRPTRQLYAQTMPQCERWMGLPPLQTAFRTID